MTGRTPCPCGSGQPYGACCGPYIEGRLSPQTAEQLMRARYSAYARGDGRWLRETWHPATRPTDPGGGVPVRWIGLEVLATAAGGPGDDQGTVEFVARYKLRGRALRLHERSRFRRLDGRWVYVDGELDPQPEPGPRSSPGDAPGQSG